MNPEKATIENIHNFNPWGIEQLPPMQRFELLLQVMQELWPDGVLTIDALMSSRKWQGNVVSCFVRVI